MVPGIYHTCALHPTLDSIRLLTIEPALDSSGLISCHLQTVTFAQRPRYNVLSYRWGDETNKKKILVAGEELDVTRNLHDAINHLRTNLAGAPIWIDAVCINQSNTAEKTRQLQIMPHIYSRAVLALVFLGARYCLSGDAATDGIAKDPYWSRLWILQEIANARQVQVLLSRPVAWPTFFDSLSPQDQETLAQFSQLREGKMDNRELRHLLKRFPDSMCKDPRDKIYGLIGLSSDSQGFPIDYAKSASDVWADTMEFLGRHRKRGLGSGDENIKDCMAMGRMVSEALGNPPFVPGLVEFRDSPNGRLHHPGGEDEDSMPVINLDADLLGTIVALGPSPSELVGSLDLTTKWQQEIQRVYPRERAAAVEESGRVMSAVLDDWDQSLSEFTTIEHDSISWYGPSYFQHGIYEPDSAVYRAAWKHAPSNPREPRFVLIKENFERDVTSTKIALVPPSAIMGDHVCRIRDAQMKPFLVRPQINPDPPTPMLHLPTVMRVVGSAALLGEKPGGEIRYRFHMSLSGKTMHALMS